MHGIIFCSVCFADVKFCITNCCFKVFPLWTLKRNYSSVTYYTILRMTESRGQNHVMQYIVYVESFFA